MIPVLYISYDGMTDPLGQSQVLPYLFGLTKHGFQFHIISLEKPDRLSKFRTTIQQKCDENGVIWHPLSFSSKIPGFSYRLNLSKLRKKAFDLQRKHNFEVTHCRSYISALIGQEMKEKFHTKFIFDMRGFWADERVDGKLWNLKNPLYKRTYNFFKRKEKEFLSDADHIVSLTENAKAEIESWNEPKEKAAITVIPCCVDTELFAPHPTAEVALRIGLGFAPDDKILGYVGSIGTWYQLPQMLDFFQFIDAQDSRWKFLFVTGEDPEKIHAEARKKGIGRKNIFVTSCLHHEVPSYIELFDLSVFFIRPSYSKKASSPTKQGEIMAMGVPIVCNAGVGDTDAIVNKYKAGIVIDHYDNESFDCLEKLEKIFDKNESMKGAKEYFGLVTGIERYLSIYKKIIH
ncbi:MAG: glycosyltransferase [Bacteroidota bacterium]